jgi:hypothetical protein
LFVYEMIHLLVVSMIPISLTLVGLATGWPIVIKTPMHNYTVTGVFNEGLDILAYNAELENGSRVRVRCDLRGKEFAEGEMEFGIMEKVQPSAWSPNPIELFSATVSKVCISTQYFTLDLGTYRTQRREEWPVSFLASLGIQLVDALKALHSEHGFDHMDIGPSRLALKKPDLDQVILFDYSTTKAELAPMDRARALRSMALAVTYLYSSGRSSPGNCGKLCDAAQYAANLGALVSNVDYDYVRGMYLEMLTDINVTYKGTLVDVPAIFKDVQDLPTTTKSVEGYIAPPRVAYRNHPYHTSHLGCTLSCPCSIPPVTLAFIPNPSTAEHHAKIPPAANPHRGTLGSHRDALRQVHYL